MKGEPKAVRGSKYDVIIEHVFAVHYVPGATEIDFTREDIAKAARVLNLSLPKNLGDLVYSFRYRKQLPASITSKAPAGTAERACE